MEKQTPLSKLKEKNKILKKKLEIAIDVLGGYAKCKPVEVYLPVKRNDNIIEMAKQVVDISAPARLCLETIKRQRKTN